MQYAKILWEIIKKLEEEKELRAKLKYGYKVVFAPVLVKLSFPDDAELVNLKSSKSRANKAFVESVTMLKNFEGEGVTNYSYSDILNYKVGEVVYPDKFDNNTNEMSRARIVYKDAGFGIDTLEDDFLNE